MRARSTSRTGGRASSDTLVYGLGTRGKGETMRITPNTQLCISIAERPGRYGITVHNAGFRALGLDYVYKACQVRDLRGAVAGIRALGIRGAGVSMPFKQAVLELLDALDASAEAVGAVNTIVNDHGRLTGFNTDVIAVRNALARVSFDAAEPVLLLGAGGVARAVRCALLERGAHEVHVAARDLERARAFVRGTQFHVVPWDARERVRATLIVNATPIGMSPDVDACPCTSTMLDATRAVIEIVATPAETTLLREARRRDKAVSSGPELSLDQAVAQFELYTGQVAPRAAMQAALEQR